MRVEVPGERRPAGPRDVDDGDDDGALNGGPIHPGDPGLLIMIFTSKINGRDRGRFLRAISATPRWPGKFAPSN